MHELSPDEQNDFEAARAKHAAEGVELTEEGWVRWREAQAHAHDRPEQWACIGFGEVDGRRVGVLKAVETTSEFHRFVNDCLPGLTVEEMSSFIAEADAVPEEHRERVMSDNLFARMSV